MSLRLRQILLRVETEAGPYGVSIQFGDGLVVLWADNSMGKSTVVQSFIYGLGLEGMLSASQAVPLPHVMTDSVHDGATTHRVSTSYVSVEIENQRMERITLTRFAKGGRDHNLVTVTFGPSLSEPSNYESRDYFVRIPGSATREAGLHHWLAKWIGWNLPIVTKYDGAECPLYMECMFPLMVVEQKHGWAGIPARMPMQYHIRDVLKRAVEFVLDLEVYQITIKRQRLKEESAAVKNEWREMTKAADAMLRQANGLIQNLPATPVDSWPPKLAPTAVITRNNKWFPISEAIRFDRTELARLETQEIPRVQNISAEAAQSLHRAESELAEAEFVRRQLFDEVQMESSQVEGLSNRIAALEEDVQRNKDVRKLREMGSEQQLELADGACPTCHRPLPDSLMPLAALQEPMTIDDNIAYLESQLETFRAAHGSSAQALVAKERRLSALVAHSDEIRSQIRSLKETLVSRGQEPSIAAVEERIRLRESIRMLGRVDENFSDLLERFSVASIKWRSVQQQIKSLPDSDLSRSDLAKLSALQELFIEQATAFGVTSLAPKSLMISRETYKPIHDGFELEFDLSASDMIRVIWAYLLSLLEVAGRVQSNHLGFFLLDEPRQQEANRVSLDQFMRRASAVASNGRQVIIATSEDRGSLESRLAGMRHTYIPFEGWIIKKLS